MGEVMWAAVLAVCAGFGAANFYVDNGYTDVYFDTGRPSFTLKENPPYMGEAKRWLTVSLQSLAEVSADGTVLQQHRLWKRKQRQTLR